MVDRWGAGHHPTKHGVVRVRAPLGKVDKSEPVIANPRDSLLRVVRASIPDHDHLEPRIRLLQDRGDAPLSDHARAVVGRHADTDQRLRRYGVTLLPASVLL